MNTKEAIETLSWIKVFTNIKCEVINAIIEQLREKEKLEERLKKLKDVIDK